MLTLLQLFWQQAQRGAARSSRCLSTTSAWTQTPHTFEGGYYPGADFVRNAVAPNQFVLLGNDDGKAAAKHFEILDIIHHGPLLHRVCRNEHSTVVVAVVHLRVLYMSMFVVYTSDLYDSATCEVSLMLFIILALGHTVFGELEFRGMLVVGRPADTPQTNDSWISAHRPARRLHDSRQRHPRTIQHSQAGQGRPED